VLCRACGAALVGKGDVISEKHFHIQMDPRKSGLFVVVTHKPTGIQRVDGPVESGMVHRVTQRLICRIRTELYDPKEFEMDIGRSSEGTYKLVRHVPSGKQRGIPSIGGRGNVTEELLDELVAELWQEGFRPNAA
jgi:hypothetical protein